MSEELRIDPLLPEMMELVKIIYVLRSANSPPVTSLYRNTPKVIDGGP
jgi:hypothetical protein